MLFMRLVFMSVFLILILFIGCASNPEEGSSFSSQSSSQSYSDSTISLKLKVNSLKLKSPAVQINITPLLNNATSYYNFGLYFNAIPPFWKRELRANQ